MVESASIEILYKTYFKYENIGILAPSLYDNSNNRRSNGNLSYINREKISKKNILKRTFKNKSKKTKKLSKTKVTKSIKPVKKIKKSVKLKSKKTVQKKQNKSIKKRSK